jgi:hypothetical protein
MQRGCPNAQAGRGFEQGDESRLGGIVADRRSKHRADRANQCSRQAIVGIARIHLTSLHKVRRMSVTEAKHGLLALQQCQGPRQCGLCVAGRQAAKANERRTGIAGRAGLLRPQFDKITKLIVRRDD